MKTYIIEDIKNITMDDVVLQTSNDKNFDFLEISWQLTNECNYKCTYCYGQDPIMKDSYTKIDKLKFIVDQIFSINKKYYHFSFLGGEVTFLPTLFELIEYIDSFNKNVIVHILTNGSKNIEYFRKLKTLKTYVNIGISIHLEYADFDHMKELIELFNELDDPHCMIVLMAHPELKEKFKYFFDNFLELRKKLYFNLYITEIVEPPNFVNIDSRYTEDYFKLIDECRTRLDKVVKENQYKGNNSVYKDFFMPKYYYKFKNNNDDILMDPSLALRNGLKKFKNFYCCGGIELLRINHDGSYVGTFCGVYKVGNIYDGIDLLKLSKPILCPLEECGCVSDNRSSKFRSKSEADSYVSKYIQNNSGNIISQLYRKLENTNISDDVVNNERFNRLVDSIAWWIPVKKWRDNFRNKILYGESRAEQSRAEQSRLITIIYINNTTEYKKIQPTLQYINAA